jgi:hypothetical protein
MKNNRTKLVTAVISLAFLAAYLIAFISISITTLALIWPIGPNVPLWVP